jgi:hypothetical protein
MMFWMPPETFVVLSQHPKERVAVVVGSPASVEASDPAPPNE